MGLTPLKQACQTHYGALQGLCGVVVRHCLARLHRFCAAGHGKHSYQYSLVHKRKCCLFVTKFQIPLYLRETGST